MQEGPAIGGFAAYYTGLMDDFSVDNKALTDTEIAALCQQWHTGHRSRDAPHICIFIRP